MRIYFLFLLICLQCSFTKGSKDDPRNQLLFLLAFLNLGATTEQPQTDIDPSTVAFPQTNGVVASQVRIGDSLYVIGEFGSIGFPTDKYAELKFSDGSLVKNKQILVTGTQVNKILVDGSGRTYLLGLFTAVDDQTRTNIARINADGTISSFAPSVNGQIRTGYILSNNKMILVGSFNAIDGNATTSGIAAIDLNTDAVDTAWSRATTPTNSVFSVTQVGSAVYLGGFFTTIDGQTRTGLAKYSLTGVIDSTWSISITGTSFSINALAGSSDGTRLFLGGRFDTVAATVRPHLASVDISGVPTLDAGFGTNFTFSATNNNVVKLIASGNLSDGSLYACGRFSSNGGLNGLLKVSQASATVDTNYKIPSLVSANNIVDCELNDGFVYLAGQFSVSFSQGIRSNLIKFDPSKKDLDFTFNPFPSSTVSSLLVKDGNLLAGGSFQSIGGASRKDFAGINLTEIKITDVDLQFPTGGFMKSGERFGSSIILGGSFFRIGSSSQRYLAKINPVSGEVDQNFFPSIDGTVNKVFNMDGDLLIAGNFQLISNNARPRFAKLNPTSGALVREFQALPDGDVKSCIVYRGDYLCAGSFTKISNVSCNQLCLIDRLTGQVKDTNFKFVGSIEKITKIADRIYIMGNLTSWEDTPINGLVSVSGENVKQIVSTEISVNGLVRDILKKENRMVVGGSMVSSGETSLGGLAQYSFGATTVSASNPSCNREINTLQTIGKKTFSVGGTFSTLNSKTQMGLGLIQFSE
ncbi:delta-60 repeat domain-containing protein [Leptospira ognonensis]|nr:delta-60 repeat domain-containing protein [Leptospira ognonensis]